MILKNNILKGIDIFIFLAIFISCAPKQSDGDIATIKFEKSIHDFKEIPKGTSVGVDFKFLNAGGVPLLIYDVKTSCGCTVSEWTKEAIIPNGGGTIKVKYDAKHFGNFNKTITIFYNGINSTHQLTIKGEVVDTKNEEVSIRTKITQ